MTRLDGTWRALRATGWLRGVAVFVAVAALAGAPTAIQGQELLEAASGGPQPLAVTKGKEYTLEKWAEGVYLATGGTGSQNCVIVNDQDVLLYDTGTTPAGARALLEDLRLVTDKPVKTVVNSHFHYDHAFGNKAFGPDVEIIAHRFTKTALQTFDTLHREPYLSWIRRNTPAQIEPMRKRVADETDAQRKSVLESQLAALLRDIDRAKEISPVLPTRTFEDRLTLTRGKREIQLLHLGRGHTAGDVVLFLPRERIVCSGDLMEGGLPYLGDGYFTEWVKTLEAMKQLAFDIGLPGHGRPFKGTAHVTHLQEYLTDVVKQVSAIRARGIPAEDALQAVDFSAHEKNWPPRMRPLDIRGMRRVYQWLEEEAAR